MIPRSIRWLGLGTWAFAAGLALAEPLPALEQEDAAAGLPMPEAADAAESPVDVQAWVERETTADLLHRAAEHDRLALLEHGWQDRAPTWIQAGATVNLADFPSLDDAAGKADRDIKTLEWVLEEQRRLREGQKSQLEHPGGSPETGVDRWLRSLIPRELVITLKAHREWVAAGGTALLVMIWATATFARRPGSGSTATEAPAAPERRRRRRRHSDHAEPGTRPAPLADGARTRY